MIRRRDVINRLVFGGSTLTLTDSAPRLSGDSDAVSDRIAADLIKAVQGVRDELARQSSFWEIATVRDQMRTFLRANGKFPDFIEVGAEVWQQVYDWHVRFQQPIALNRTTDGRQTIMLMTTAVIMRTDLTPGYIGTAYDNR